MGTISYKYEQLQHPGQIWMANDKQLRARQLDLKTAVATMLIVITLET